MRRTREFLEANFEQNVSLADLTNLVGLSSYHLLRVFRSEVGLPPHAYLEQIRINYAKQLLRSGMPIVEVAVNTGFVDQSHFTRHFKRHVGITPGLYQVSSKNIQDHRVIFA